MTINAVQVNYQDFNAEIFGKPDTLKQQFVIKTSEDGKKWKVAIDFSDNQQDRPHAYIELENPVQGRYVKFENVYFPNKYLAVGEFRVFGNGNGEKPEMPESFSARRQTDERNADVSWDAVDDAMGYTLYWGIKPDQLNNSVMIYGENSYELRALNVGVDYYMQMETFNENGISEKTKILKVN